MKLISIFVGTPTKVMANVKEVETGIYKTEVTHPVKVTFTNIEGDQQADLKVHGGRVKAVYAYPEQHYEFWKSKRPNMEFPKGLFGENLSITGLDELVFVGNTYRIGSVVFQVTTPRMPCFKLGIKVGDASFIKDFMQARKNGFYLRVLEEGTIQPDDEIIALEEDPNQLTIDEVIQLYTIRKEEVALLDKAIGTEALPEDWREYFVEKRDKL